ncbi:ATP-binding cassette domain-containing protein [Clostridium gasigenes]|uniref:ABC transporter ATP-binding protein n=1 Tax=Clostridium gasigenes TaxID=94869 RepID=UPI001C0BD606|nr:ATP-binding cassette domain-containing protein [Clostridium gasigenes]MBU3089185.1 ATP-binding cassette domain-containing protein [Clostridium gasigenes]
MNENSVVSLKNITKIYEKGNLIALDNINLEIAKGEIIGVIGRNGAGKSTMFKIICGLIRPDLGEFKIENKTGKVNMISYLPEERGLDTRQIVEEHLVDLVCYKGIKRKDAKRMITKWLKEFNMYDHRYKPIDSLSKGNQQKLQFISAIANEPEILILDEPFTGLDAITSDYLWEKIMKLKGNGSTIIYSTHNLNDKLLLSDSFVFLVEGNIIEQGKLEDIQDKYDMVLEIESNEIDDQELYKAAESKNIVKQGNKYFLDVDSEELAKVIFNKLDRPYCSNFNVRKLNISELFRLFNRKGVGNESEIKKCN